MRLTVPWTVGLLLFLLVWAGPALGAPPESPMVKPAGKVLLVQGRVVAVDPEGTARVLERAAQVFEGDTLVTEEGSRAQVRFSDGGLLSLRPQSKFRIERYRFESGAGGQESAFFRLLKGGFRTVTGLIGSSNRDAYKVETPVATIGKRGTHYALYLCSAGGCVSPEPLPDGLYGGVLEGAVASRNLAGEMVFTDDQFFRVRRRDALPERLPGPPAILSRADALQAAAAGKRRRLPSDGLDGGLVQPAPTTFSDQALPLVADVPVYQDGEQRDDDILASATLAGDPGTTDASTDGGTDDPDTTDDANVVALASFVEQKNSVSFEPSGGAVQAPTPSAQLVVDDTGSVAHLAWAQNSNPKAACQPCGFDHGGATLLDAGSIGRADVGRINWGRWNGDYSVSSGNAVGDFHFIDSADLATATKLNDPRVTALGVATFTYLGHGTAPTDEAGGVGRVNSASATVDFGAQQVTGYDLHVSTPGLEWKAGFHGAVDLDSAFQGGIPLAGTPQDGLGCTGWTSSGNVVGNASMQFIGPEAERAMSAYGLRNQSGEHAVSGTLVLDRSPAVLRVSSDD